MGAVRHRRNHAVAGLALVLAGLLTFLSTTQGLVRIDGPAFTAGFAKQLGLEVQTGFDYGLDEETVAAVFGGAAGFVVFGLLLLVTRVRFLGLLWRFCGLLCVGLTGLFVYAAWTFVGDPVSVIEEANPEEADILRGGVSLARGLGLLDVSPGPGLYLLTAASVVALLGVLVPAGRRTKPAHEPTSA